jgi:hypothetical protein
VQRARRVDGLALIQLRTPLLGWRHDSQKS